MDNQLEPRRSKGWQFINELFDFQLDDAVCSRFPCPGYIITNQGVSDFRYGGIHMRTPSVDAFSTSSSTHDAGTRTAESSLMWGIRPSRYIRLNVARLIPNRRQTSCLRRNFLASGAYPAPRGVVVLSFISLNSHRDHRPHGFSKRFSAVYLLMLHDESILSQPDAFWHRSQG